MKTIILTIAVAAMTFAQTPAPAAPTAPAAPAKTAKKAAKKVTKTETTKVAAAKPTETAKPTVK